MADTIQTLALALARVLRPLAETLDASDDDIAGFIEELGYTLPAVPPSLSGLRGVADPLLSSLENVEDELMKLDEGEGSEDALLAAVAQLVLDVAQLAGRVAQLRTTLPTELPPAYIAATNIAQDLLTRLYDYLIIQSMEEGATILTHVLMLLGIFEVIEQEEDPAKHQPDFQLHRIRWERIPRALEDPPAILGEVYGWGTPDLDVEKLFEALQTLSLDLLSPAEIGYPTDAMLEAVGVAGSIAPDDGPDPELVIPLFVTEAVTLAIALYPLPLANPTEPRGLAATLRASGEINVEIPLSERIVLAISSGVDLAPGVAVVIRPNQPVSIIEHVSSGGAASILRGARVELRITYGSQSDTELLRLLSIPGGSGVEARQLYFAIGAEASGAGDAGVGVEGGIIGGKIIVSTTEVDTFLTTLLPQDGLEVDFDFTLGWSSTRGVYFHGSGSLETAIPLHTSVGPFALDTLYLVLGVAPDGLQLEVSVSGGGAIGPVSAAVERLGISSDLAFAEGNLGPVDLNLGFKPPDGLGILIDAGAITGGGFLSFDHENGRYAGIVQLQIYSVAVTAIGLLDTRLPGGAPGFSFLIIITAEFPPIQLGFGLTLNGAGGLAAIHRTIVVEALQAGVRTGSVDHILFPEDPIRDAPRIISDLRTIFPPVQDQYVFGPMALIAWGTPTLIEVELGIILELPDPVRIILLGQMTAILPEKDAAIVELHIDVLGVIDFEAKLLAIDASLHDSRVAAFPIYGDMALRLTWADPPNFALAIGGFHPHFQPPPGFPTLRRLTIALGESENPRLSLQAYAALTSNSAQFGARAELYAEAGRFNVYGFIGFDALFIFSPFSFRTDLSAGIALRKNSSHIAGIYLNATLTGPTPWHAWGEACISVLFFDVCVGFDATFGAARANILPETDPWPLLKAAIEGPRNWSAALPPAAVPAVTLAKPPPPAEPGPPPVLVDPVGSAALHQRVLPLNRRITKFGESRPTGPDRYSLTGIRLGDTQLVASAWTAVHDFFAPGQFEQLSDAQKLSAPSFKEMDAGVALASNAVTLGTGLGTSVVYETIVVDSPWESHRAEDYSLRLAHQQAMLRRGAAAHALVHNMGLGKFAADPRAPKKVHLEPKRFGVASTDDLSLRTDIIALTTQDAAEQALADHLAAHPEDRDWLQVVPADEIQVPA